MHRSWHLDDLEVIGYADLLRADVLPSIAPPIFRPKSDLIRALLPPFRIDSGFLCNATEAAVAELEQLRDEGRITLFPSSFPAAGAFELWIDQLFGHHYEPIAAARRSLSLIAHEQVVAAKKALEDGDLERAERSAQIALSADDRRVDPLAIKAAIRRARKDASGERLMARMAEHVLEHDAFALLVEHYTGYW